ncbi:MAG: diphthine--ammonia ligase [Candidatus Woesearchaeota archaeon]|jgi:asparagine synthase (glutamine-hydrolysing)
MCGIVGFFNMQDARIRSETALEIIKHRGKDAYGYADAFNLCINEDLPGETAHAIGHALHAMNDLIPQPIAEGDFVFITNCEIYNWKELNKKYGLETKNDAETLFKILSISHDLMETLEELDGVYAFCLWNKKTGKVFLARDIIGERPLWVYFDKEEDGFAFASEKKAMLGTGLNKRDIFELNPRHLLIYDLETNYLSRVYRSFFETGQTDDTQEEILLKTEKILLNAIKKRLPKNRKIGLLFSGGIDSAFLALILKKLGVEFTCYFSSMKEEGLSDSKDQPWAEKIAKELDLKLNLAEINLLQVEDYLKKITHLIEDNNVTKTSVALTMYVAAERAKKDGVQILFSGIGSEDIFAGYRRHKHGGKINEECLAGLRRIYERDLYRDDAIMMSHTIELRAPYLDLDLIKYSLTIPEELKLNNEEDKLLLRRIAIKNGLAPEYAFRKKVAAQYGSNFDKAIHKLANKEKKSKPEYLKKFHDEGNVRLGVLLSTGKDSCLAAQLMIDQNYAIECFITLKSKNADSYMYHGPNVDLAILQAESAQKPLILQETTGEKEKELSDLRKALITAIEKYNIEGVVTGALFSHYQRDRIEKICDELGLKCFSPMWHMLQEKELEVLLSRGIKFCIVKIAAEGLTKDWLGKVITQKEIDLLQELNKKMGFNVAGEGGEYESLTLDAPFFKKELVLTKTRIDVEDEYTATLIVEDAELKDK